MSTLCNNSSFHVQQLLSHCLMLLRSFANSLGTTWTDTYPTSIGASTGSSCVNDNNGGPALASDDTGTFNPNDNGRWGKTSTESGSMFYWHEGLWDVDSKNHGGLGTVWLR